MCFRPVYWHEYLGFIFYCHDRVECCEDFVEFFIDVNVLSHITDGYPSIPHRINVLCNSLQSLPTWQSRLLESSPCLQSNDDHDYEFIPLQTSIVIEVKEIEHHPHFIMVLSMRKEGNSSKDFIYAYFSPLFMNLRFIIRC
jgi:hypothetical protein